MTIVEAVACRLEQIMKEKGLTQYKVFKLSGVAQSTISEILHRHSKSINLVTIYEMVDGLEMELLDFFDSPLFKRENLE